MDIIKGDLVLKHVPKIPAKNLRASDVIGRYGGEEFVLYYHLLFIENAVLLAEVCRKALEQTIVEVKENEMLYIKACFWGK